MIIVGNDSNIFRVQDFEQEFSDIIYPQNCSNLVYMIFNQKISDRIFYQPFNLNIKARFIQGIHCPVYSIMVLQTVNLSYSFGFGLVFTKHHETKEYIHFQELMF